MHIFYQKLFLRPTRKYFLRKCPSPIHFRFLFILSFSPLTLSLSSVSFFTVKFLSFSRSFCPSTLTFLLFILTTDPHSVCRSFSRSTLILRQKTMITHMHRSFFNLLCIYRIYLPSSAAKLSVYMYFPYFLFQSQCLLTKQIKLVTFSTR